MKRVTFVSLIIFAVCSAVFTGFWACDPPDPTDSTFISVVASAYEVPADGNSTVKITATVYDNTHNTVADGTAVFFSVSCGQLDAGVGTTAGGQASVVLTAHVNPCKAVVNVEVPSENRRAVSSPIDMYDIGPQTIKLIADPNQIKANGNQSSIITAEVFRENQEHVPDGTDVNFSSDKGTLTPEQATTANGFATVTLTSDTNPGTCTITANAEDESAEATVEFLSIDCNTLVLDTDTTQIRADGNSKALLTAKVYRTYPDEYVEDGASVLFTTDKGTVSPTQATTVGGFAFTTLTSDTTAGTAVVTATSGGCSDFENIYFFNVGPAYISQLDANPNSIPADGESHSIINAVVRNSNYEPVAAGTVVEFATTQGSITPSATTDSGGAASATLTSSTNIDPSVRVTAVSGPAARNVYLSFTQPTSTNVAYLNVFIGTTSFTVGSDEDVPIIVRVNNQYNTGIPHKTVQVQAECGQFTPNYGNTDADGQIDFVWDISECTNAKNITISATCDNVVGTATVAFTPEAPCHLTLTADSSVINGGTASGSTTLRTTSYDRYYNFVEDEDDNTVYFTYVGSDCASPTFSFYPSQVNTIGGAANTIFKVEAGSNPGPNNCSITVQATISDNDPTCSVSDFTQSITLTITP